MASDNTVETQPPAPPASRPRIDLTRLQRIGMPIMLSFPVLALAGVFGDGRTSLDQVGDVLAMHVDAPSRIRYGTTHQLTVSIRNGSAQRLDSLVVSFDSAYVTRFQDVVITPAVHHPFSTILTDVAPHETRVVTIELRGAKYGAHRGRVVARSASDSVQAWVRTFTFP